MDELATKMFADGREPVVEFNGRWFITFGQAGFNSPANNGAGYGSKGSAEAAIRRYQGPAGPRLDTLKALGAKPLGGA